MHDYTTPIMASYWSRQSQLDHWAIIECALLRELVPGRTLARVRIDAAAVDLREQHTGHEVGAFLELFEDRLEEPEHKRWLHYGLTSSDLVDSARQITLNLTTHRLSSATLALLRRVSKLPEVPVVGRTHGQPASPTSYHHRWVVAMNNANDLIAWDRTTRPAVMLSGATGRHRTLSEEQAGRVARAIGADLVRGTTQVLPAYYTMQHLNRWQGLVLAIEQIALDLRLGAMMGEARPQAHPVGSTAMPGKINPIKAERLCGLAKLWRGYYSAVVESRALWLDRDLHHSSVDRVALGQLAGLAHFMASELDSALAQVELRPTYASGDLLMPSGVNADALLGLATWAYLAPRREVYERLTDAIRAGSIVTTGVIYQMHQWQFSGLERSHEWDGTLDGLTHRYTVCYSGNCDERTTDGHQDD